MEEKLCPFQQWAPHNGSLLIKCQGSKCRAWGKIGRKYEGSKDEPIGWYYGCKLIPKDQWF